MPINLSIYAYLYTCLFTSDIGTLEFVRLEKLVGNCNSLMNFKTRISNKKFMLCQLTLVTTTFDINFKTNDVSFKPKGVRIAQL